MKKLVYLMTDDRRDIDLLYGYTFLFDPFILDMIQSVPQMESIRSSRRRPADLLVSCSSHQFLPKDQQKILLDGVTATLKRNGAAVLVQPSRMFYNGLPQLKEQKYLRDLVSLCEEWRINTPSCKHVQDYPQQTMFQAVQGKGEVWATVGDWPAMIVNERLALFTVDQMRAFARWHRRDNLPAHVNLWVDLVSRLLGKESPALPEAETETDLRRDFHAFGYALVLLRELASLQKKNVAAEERSACGSLLEAAALFTRKQYALSQAKLKSAFNILYSARLKITRMNIHLVDSAHGSTLFDNVGFCEMQWPQEVGAMIEFFTHLVEKRNYRFCLDWDACTIENLAKRFPKLTARMRALVQEGKLEFINGGYVQQYPHFWFAQSAVQNFKYGREVFQSVFGRPVTTYGGQECCLNPQMPNLLVKSGYKRALHRIQNFGHAPLVREAAITWRGTDGSKLPAIPGNPSATERLGGMSYLLLAYKINQSIEQGARDPVFTNMQDLCPIAFREEVCRIAYYAPVFGRHTTISEYFKQLRKKSLPIKSFNYSDYLYGYFYVGHNWRGDENDGFVKAFALERAIAEGQFINGLAAFRSGKRPKDWGNHWKKVFGLQSHDSLIAGNIFTGGFYYKGGPFNMSVTNAGKVRENYARLLADAGKTAAHDLNLLLRGRGKRNVYVNTLGFARRVPVDDNGRGAEVLLPAYGYSASLEYTKDRAAVSHEILENDQIAVRFNRENGCIENIFDKTAGRKIVAECNELVYGDDSRMDLQEFEITGRSGHKASVRIKGVIRRKKELIAFYETRLTLTGQSRVVDVKTSLTPVVEIPPNPCDHAFRFKIKLAADFDVMRGCLNVAEPLREGPIFKQVYKFDPPMWFIFYKPSDPQMKMFSSPYYVRLQSRMDAVDIFNDGVQLYYNKGNCLYQHLIGNNDTLREFNYAIAVNDTRRHPLISSLDWQTPVLTAKAAISGAWGLFASDRNNLLLFGAEYIGKKTFILRIAELEGRRTRAVISCGHAVRGVVESDYLGNPMRRIKSNKRQFAVQLTNWGISEYRIQLW